MPITKTEFEQISSFAKFPGSNALNILEFLKANGEIAFTAKEISEKTFVKNVYVYLTNFKQKGLIEHKRPFWIWKGEKNDGRTSGL